MKTYLSISHNGTNYCYSILNNCNSCRVELLNEFIIDIFKRHNHCYVYKAFFYNTKNLYSIREVHTKSKLISAIQELLKQELYDVQQY